MTDDADLLAAWRAGDARAGETLFERHVPSVIRFFRNKIDHGVEDLVQATFLACLESEHRFEGRGSFRSFLLGVARHKLFRHYRDERGSLEQLDFGSQSFADLAPGVSTVLAHQGEDQLLLQALRSIPVDLQIVIELYYWEDMTAAEIAVACELPEGTVRTRIRTARRLLAERIAQVAAGEEALEQTATDLDRWAATIRRRWQQR